MREAANAVKWDPMVDVERTAWNWDSYVKHLIQRYINPVEGSFSTYAHAVNQDAIGKQL